MPPLTRRSRLRRSIMLQYIQALFTPRQDPRLQLMPRLLDKLQDQAQAQSDDVCQSHKDHNEDYIERGAGVVGEDAVRYGEEGLCRGGGVLESRRLINEDMLGKERRGLR